MSGQARWWAGVLAACAVALAVRLLAIALFQGFGTPPDRHAQPDQVDYEATGWELASGHGFSVAGQPSWFRPPGTSFLIAGVYRVTGRSWTALRVTFALLSALTCAALAALGRRAFGATTGMVAAWALAFDPAHFYYALHFLSEVPYALLITGGTWLGVAAVGKVRMAHPTRERERATSAYTVALIAGVVLGAAILVRPQALLVLPAALLLALLARGWRRRALGLVALAALGAVTVVAPWVARNAVRFGHVAIAGVGPTTLYGSNNAQVLADPAFCGSWISMRRALGIEALPRDETLYAERSAAGAREFLRRHWRELPRLEACKAERLVSLWLVTPNRAAQLAFAVAWVLVAPLTALGLWSGVRRHRAATAIAVLPVVALGLTALVFYGAIRFRHSTEPSLVLLAALGAVEWPLRRWLRTDGAAIDEVRAGSYGSASRNYR